MFGTPPPPLDLPDLKNSPRGRGGGGGPETLRILTRRGGSQNPDFWLTGPYVIEAHKLGTHTRGSNVTE